MFGRALALVRTHPSLALPGQVLALVLALVQSASTPAEPLDDDLARRSVRSIAQAVATIVSFALTTAMADAARRDGRASIFRGARRFGRSGAHVVVATIALVALGAIAAVLAPFTFGLSFLVFAFFCVYAPASAISGYRSGMRAIAESVDLAFRRPLATLAVVVPGAVVALAAGALTESVAGPPFARSFVADALIQFVVAYAALVVAGEYRMVRDPGVAA